MGEVEEYFLFFDPAIPRGLESLYANIEGGKYFSFFVWYFVDDLKLH